MSAMSHGHARLRSALMRSALLRSVPLVLIAACLCNACSAPAPPATPEPDADAAQTATPPAASADPLPTPPATASDTEPVAGSSTPQPPAPEQVPAPPPKPAAPPPAAETTPAPYEKPLPPEPIVSDPQPTNIVVTTLSRGKGVPDETRAAYKQIRAVLERQQAASNVTALQANRIGLEGETRLCAEFRNDDDAQAALAEIRKLSAGVDMLNVAVEPCPSRKVDKP